MGEVTLFPCASTVLLTFEFVYFGLLNFLAFLSLAHSIFVLFYL